MLPGVERRIGERWAFAAPWDARSTTTLRTHAAALDAAIVDWIALDTLTALPLVQFGDSLATSMPPGTRRMALLTTTVGSGAHPEVVRRLATDSATIKRTALALSDRLTRLGLRGIVIDFDGMTSRDTALTRSVITVLASAIRTRGLGPVIVSVPASDTVAYPARLFESSADFLLVRLHDEHGPTSPPGAIASSDWARRALAARVSELGASRIVASLPTYGYLWRQGRTPATPISYDEGRRLAAEAGVALERDPASGALRAVRPGVDGWELWLTDANQLDALERTVASLNVRRVTYWRLGLEDPALWENRRR